MSLKPIIDKQEKEFDDKFPVTNDFCGCLDVQEGMDVKCFWPKTHKDIKSFLHSSIKEVLTELIREVKSIELSEITYGPFRLRVTRRIITYLEEGLTNLK